MKTLKKVMTGCTTALVLSATALTAYAAVGNQTPAEVVSGITGKTIEDVLTERQEGKTYGAIAAESEKLNDFKQEMLSIHKDRLNALVDDGTLTREEADAQLAEIEERQESCDGTGSGNYSGQGRGYRMGNGNGNGNGNGYGRGRDCVPNL